MPNFTGTNANDRFDFIGLDGGEVFNGLGGQDTVNGSAVFSSYLYDLESSVLDLVSGGLQASLLNFEAVNAGSGDDRIIGGLGGAVNALTGNGGNDSISPGSDGIRTGDIYAGGSGVDTLDFVNLTGSAVIDLNSESFVIGNATATASGFEIVLAGSGNDFIRERSGVPSELHGGLGNDTLATASSGIGGGEVFDGGNGTDQFDFSNLTTNYVANLSDGSFSTSDGRFTTTLTSIERVLAGSGNDVLTAGAAEAVGYTLLGNGGNDRMSGADGNDVLRGGVGNDTMSGGDGNDALVGDAGADIITGGNGNDVARGGNNNDRVHGDSGNDRLAGNTGNDTLLGGTGNDTMQGDAGFDRMLGGAGNDSMDGGAQADNLLGDEGNDTLLGSAGFDRLFGGNDQDLAYGGTETDALFGQNGNDTLYGEADNDRLFGGVGNDLLSGGADNDNLFGGAGFDTLEGDAGNDVLQGNFNADLFVFGNGFGQDTITDFAATNDAERIDLSGLGSIVNLFDLLSNHVEQVGTDVLIDAGGGNTVTLLGVDLDDLGRSDFVF